MKLFCDLHLHSCLSPCGDEENTVGNLVGMAKLNGLDAIALTDHNTAGNCRSAWTIGRQMDLVVVPGMELTTAEDIHVVCLFPDPDAAEAFGAEVRKNWTEIPNRPDIFGRQILLDERDEPAGEEPLLLTVATAIPAERALPLAMSFGGTAFPAHVDKEANSMAAVLGSVPKEYGFAAVELSKGAGRAAEDFYLCEGYKVVRSSDAHYLWQLSEADFALELPERSAAAIVKYFLPGGRENP